MKKKYFYPAFAAALLFAGFAFTACDDDDDNSAPGTKPTIKFENVIPTKNYVQSGSFAAVAHKTPFSYLQQVRIQKSCQYLKNSDLAVSRIAVSCGFNDLSYYARRFREQVGCTPTEYRRRAQSELPGGNADQGVD